MSTTAGLVLRLSPPRAGVAPVLPPQTRRLLDAVRQGRGHAFFPPVARPGPEGALQVARHLQGEDDARMLGAALVRPRFRPLLEFLEALVPWCRSQARRHPGLLAPRVLSLTHGELFGPLVAEAFMWCAAAADDSPPEAALRTLREGFQGAFALFLTRLARDERAGVFRRAGYVTPITGLWRNPEETHNGRQSVLRVRFRKGGALAYKPRPATGEALFLADAGEGRARSLFAWLNARPAVSGAVRLPTLRVLEGRGADRSAYSWQEWISPPRQWGVLRRSGPRRLEGCQLTPREAGRFWHHAGSLTAACFAVGAADLFAGNVVVGTRPGERRPLAYPVDLEVFFCPLQGLVQTGLVADARERGNHHVAFERRARWCDAGGPELCFFDTRGGGLALRRRTRAWGREQTRSVITDTAGNAGYGAYLDAYLRGMFDVWTLLVMERARVVAVLRRAARKRLVRVLLQDSATYGAELERRMLSPGHAPARFSAPEREQLARLDVPYFFQRTEGGPLLQLAAPPNGAAWKRVGVARGLTASFRPSRRVRDGAHLTLLHLGVAVRDAIAFVFQDVREREAEGGGVRRVLRDAHRGTVSFDWPQVGRRLTYVWNRRELHVQLEELEPG